MTEDMARNQMTTGMTENIGMSRSKPAHYEVKRRIEPEKEVVLS